MLPLSGVQVWLVDPSTGAVLSTTTTSAAGQYYFIDPTLTAGTAYSIVVPLTQTVLLPYKTTISNQADTDELDSDSVPTGPNLVSIAVTAPPLGQFDFSLDFGFVPRLYDWGDLPDGVSPTSPDYNTDSSGTQGPRHEIIDGLHMGLGVDSETNGQPNGTATGDDIASTQTISDEDGIFLPTFSPGVNSVVRATAQNLLAVPAYLYGFIDFNGDGDFSDSGETVSVTVPAGTEGAIFQLPFSAPLNATLAQDIGARFRLSTDAGLGPDGNATNGEIEDYLIRVKPNTDYGDLPANYAVTTAEGGPVHTVVTGIRMGALIDTEGNGSHDPAAEFDNIDVPERADEDGAQLPVFELGQPAPITVTVVNTTGNPVTVYGFIDFNGDGDFSDAGETQSTTTSASGDVVLNFTTPTTATLFTTLGARFRVSTDAALGPNGAATDGEVEDYVFTINPPIDYGDLPDGAAGFGPLNYGTTITDVGPGHPIIPGLQLGANLDGEPDGQPDALATGDDISPTLAPDDEDGVTLPLDLVPGAPYAVSATAINTTGLPAYLYGFIDFNANGYLTDTGEFVSTTVPAGTVALTPFTLAFSAPVNTNMTTQLGARFRLSTQPGLIATGLALNGEVEDYLVEVPSLKLGDRIWFDTNNDGLDNDGPGGELQSSTGVNNVAVALYRADGSYAGATTTDASGFYTFSGLLPNGYYVVISPTNFAANGPLANYLSSDPTSLIPNDDINGDDNGYPAAGGIVRSNVITLSAGTEPSTTLKPGDANFTLDFGFYRQQVGNNIWVDSNEDGVRNNGETLYVGAITLALIDNTTGVVVSTTTTSNGVYTFTGVPSGTYVVSATIPAGYVNSTPTFSAVGAEDNDNGSPSGLFMVSAPFTATAGTNIGSISADGATGTTANPSIDFGIVTDLYDLGNRVWFDTNNNGVLDAGEQPVAGVTVTLQTANGLLTSVTDAYGLLLIYKLEAGQLCAGDCGRKLCTGCAVGRLLVEQRHRVGKR